MYHSNQFNGEFKPDNREGASLTAIGSNLFLYGGRTDHGFSAEMDNYQIKKWSWKKIKPAGNVPRDGRAYHSAVEVDNQIYVFGGQLESSFPQNKGSLSNEVHCFNPQTNIWKAIPAQGVAIEPRKGHAACVYEQAMIVYGGLDQFNGYLDDVWAYYLSKPFVNEDTAKLLITL